jgi:hypothetical protein
MRLNVTLYVHCLSCFFFNSYNSSKAEDTLMKLIQSVSQENAATVNPSRFLSLDLAHKDTDIYGNSTTNKRVSVSSFVFNRPLFDSIMRL